MFATEAVVIFTFEMMKKLHLHLCLHGSIVLTISLLCGIPYGLAIKSKEEEPTRAWKLAHSSLAMGSTTMLAVGAIIPYLEISSWACQAMVSSWILCGYGFSFALPLAAFTGNRGLNSGGSSANNFVYLGNLVGASGSLVGTLFLLSGIVSTLLQDSEAS